MKSRKIVPIFCVFSLFGCNTLVMQGGLLLPSPSPASTATSFQQTLSINSTTSSSVTNLGANLDFSSTAVELTASVSSDSDATANGFGQGLSNGANWNGVTWDTGLQALRLDTTAYLPLELNASWAPEFSSLTYYPLDNSTPDTGITNSGGSFGSPAKFGNGVQLNGSSYLTLPASKIYANNYSYAIWFKGTSGGVLLSNADAVPGGSPTTYNPLIYVGTDGIVRGGVYNNSSIPADMLDSKYTVTDNRWHQAVLTASSGTGYQYLYIDGQLQAQNSFGTLGNVTALYAGVGYTNSWNQGNSSWYYYSGTIDDIGIWSVALTDAEVLSIYQHQITHVGTFTSRVFDGLSNAQAWQSLAWKTILPSWKALPDQNANESVSDYTALDSTALMQGNVGLWHLDDAVNSTTVADTSVNLTANPSASPNNGTPSGVTFGVAGRFNTAASFNGSASISIPDSAALRATTALTLSAWVKTSSANTTQAVLYKSDASGAAPNYGNVYRIVIMNGYATALVTNSSGSPQSLFSSALIADNQWHLVSAVFDSSLNKLIIYVDGVEVAEGTTSGTLLPAVGPLNIGIAGTSFPFVGSIDEAAIWNRALSASEVAKIFRRGSNRLKFQIQTCAQISGCENSASFLGPDNSSFSYFSELYNTVSNALGGIVNASSPNLLFLNFSSLNLSTNRYFQYQAELDSDDAGSSCTYNSTASWCSPELQTASAGAHYDSSSPSFSSATPIAYQTLSAFEDTESCSSGVAFNLSTDQSSWYYWNGTAWVVASGNVSQANAKSIVNSHIAAFATLKGAGNLYLKAFLASDGTHACQINSLSVSGAR